MENGLLPENQRTTPLLALEPLLDGTRRIVEAGDFVYRFSWVLLYRSGVMRHQYERRGETLFQTLFARLDHRGVEAIFIVDQAAADSDPRKILQVDVPLEGVADILYQVEVEPGRGVVRRIYTFGWHHESVAPGTPGGGFYVFLDPREEPPRIWTGDRRPA